MLALAGRGLRYATPACPRTASRGLSDSLWRSVQFIRWDKLSSKGTKLLMKADAIVLDVEDSVEAHNKDAARMAYRQFLNDGNCENVKTIVRLNGLGSLQLERDLETLTHADVDFFMLSKAETISDLEAFQDIVGSAYDFVDDIDVIPIIESPLGVLNAAEIARHPSVKSAIIYGAADFACGMISEIGNKQLESFARAQIVTAARAYGIVPVDTAHTRIRDWASFLEHCKQSRDMGYAGTATLTLGQMQVANALYTPSLKQLRWAQRVMDAQSNNVSSTRASAQSFDEFVGPPHVTLAKKIVALSEDLKIKEQRDEERDANTTESIQIPTPTNHTAHNASMDSPVELLMPIVVSGGVTTDFHSIEIGSIVQSDYEICISSAMHVAWKAQFFASNLLQSSPLAVRKLFSVDNGDKEMVSGSLLGTLVLSMSIPKLTENAKVHLGMYNAVQHRPVLAGETVRNAFQFCDVKEVSKGQVIVDTRHFLTSAETGELLFESGKRSMFAPSSIQCTKEFMFESSSSYKYDITDKTDLTQKSLDFHVNRIVDNIKSTAKEGVYLPETDPELPVPGHIYAHRIVKVFEASDVLGLCNLCRMTNAHHLDRERFFPTEILVPGPLVLAATAGNCMSDFGDVLHEEWIHATNINPVNHGDQIISISHITSSKMFGGDKYCYEIEVQTLGFKNVDFETITSIRFPKHFFSKSTPLKPSAYEHILQEFCPSLRHRLACQLSRKILCWKPHLTTASILDRQIEEFCIDSATPDLHL